MNSSAQRFPNLRPLYQADRGRAFNILAVLLGSVALTASSYISVPMLPVPMTMQTLVVTLIGAMYGWRLGAATVVAWLLEAALGLPVLAGGAGGALYFLGKTGGYLFAFPLAAMATGWLAERGWDGRRPVRAFGAMAIGNAMCLGLGAAWLASFIGWNHAVAFGVAPFVVGGLLKSVLGAALLKALALGRKPQA